MKRIGNAALAFVLLFGTYVVMDIGLSLADDRKGCCDDQDKPGIPEPIQEKQPDKFTKNVNSVWVPGAKAFGHFTPRKDLDKGLPAAKFKMGTAKPLPPAPKLPIDWARSLSFPMLGNDQYGDCMYAAAAHQDQTWTGNTGVGGQSQFNLNPFVQCYLKLSGGDNGLDAGTLQRGWKKGICGLQPDAAQFAKTATILDAATIDPNDADSCQSAINLFGGVVFMFAVPDRWINTFQTGAVWDAPATPNEMNGHGVLWNGVRLDGSYRLQTWGSYVWITPAGVKSCDPSAFVAFSLRWFNPQGYAANGLHYTTLAPLWTQFTGNQLPNSPFPAPGPTPTPTPPTPPTPTPTPTPTPGSVQITLTPEQVQAVLQQANAGKLSNEQIQAIRAAAQAILDATAKPGR